MKGNVHLVYLECGNCVVCRYKTHIDVVAKWMDIYNFPPSQLQKQFCDLSFRM